MLVNPQDYVIAVFEKQPYWGPELQRQFQHASVTIRECRAVTDLIGTTQDFLQALLVIDLADKPRDCLDWLGSLMISGSRRLPIIACGSADTADLEWSVRELGVTAFLPDVIPGDDFARLCRRQLGLVR